LADTEHAIEYESSGSWQAGDIHWALCECGWASKRDPNLAVVEAHVRQHLDEVGAAA